MANISKNVYNEIVIDGPIIPDDIVFLNRIESEANICFKNTKYLSSELLKQINNRKLTFSIIGGLERSKSKYDNDHYQQRTYHTVAELIKILEYFEYIEQGITPDMNEMQKCMFIYCSLIRDTNYVEEYRDADVSSKLIENSLTGNLYHKLTCSGIALTFKEMLDRQDIKCDYLNKRNRHAFNRVVIDGKTYGIDLTWDLGRYEREGEIFFTYFGRQNKDEFYRNDHDLRYDTDETMTELDTYTQEEIDNCYNSIKPKLDRRKKHTPAISQLTKEEKIQTLRLLHTYSDLQKEESYINLILYLKKNKMIDENDPRLAFAYHRHPIVGDIVTVNISRLENVEGIDEYYYFNNPNESFAEIAKRAIDQYLESYIKEFFAMSAIYNNSFKYVPFEVDEESYIIYFNIKSKIEYFASIKDIVIKMGYEEELNYFIYKLKKEEEKRNEAILEKTEVKSQYDSDYDYLAGSISPEEMLFVKEYIEKQNGKKISLDEFKIYFTDPTFMRKRFIQEWNFTDKELEKLLKEVYEKKLPLMIELMDKIKETPTEKKSNPNTFDEPNNINDVFEWNTTDFTDDQSTNMSFF